MNRRLEGGRSKEKEVKKNCKRERWELSLLQKEREKGKIGEQLS